MTREDDHFILIHVVLLKYPRRGPEPSGKCVIVRMKLVNHKWISLKRAIEVQSDSLRLKFLQIHSLMIINV